MFTGARELGLEHIFGGNTVQPMTAICLSESVTAEWDLKT